MFLLFIISEVVAKTRVTMISKWACFVCYALLSVCDSAFVDSLSKCSHKDDDCVKGLVQNILQDISKNGVEELDVPVLDPMVLKNISIPIFGLFNITLDEVYLKGIKESVIDSIHDDLEKGKSNLDLTCDLTIKTKFKLADISPLVKNFIDLNSIHANGNLKIKLEKLHLKLQFFYHMIRKNDGDVYFKCHLEDFLYDYDIGNLKMTANKIFFGDLDISDFVESFVNQNWKSIMPIFGKSIFDVAMNIFKDILHRFFDTVPAKHYLIDDLSSFVKN